MTIDVTIISKLITGLPWPLYYKLLQTSVTKPRLIMTSSRMIIFITINLPVNHTIGLPSFDQSSVTLALLPKRTFLSERQSELEQLIDATQIKVSNMSLCFALKYVL